MITLEKILRLRSVPLFADLDARELGRIAVLAGEVPCASGQSLFNVGDEGTCLHVVLEGEIRVHVGSRTLKLLGPQTFLGEMAMLDGGPRSASATAVVDSLLLTIEQEDFLRVLEQHPKAALSVIRTLSRRLREADAEPSADAPPT